jgi:hypothetical protein
MRLSMMKAAHTAIERAAYRKSGYLARTLRQMWDTRSLTPSLSITPMIVEIRVHPISIHADRSAAFPFVIPPAPPCSGTEAKPWPAQHLAQQNNGCPIDFGCLSSPEPWETVRRYCWRRLRVISHLSREQSFPDSSNGSDDGSTSRCAANEDVPMCRSTPIPAQASAHISRWSSAHMGG